MYLLAVATKVFSATNFFLTCQFVAGASVRFLCSVTAFLIDSVDRTDSERSGRKKFQTYLVKINLFKNSIIPFRLLYL